MFLELLLKDVRILASKQHRLVEAADRAREVDQPPQAVVRLRVLLVRPARAVVVCGEVRLEARDCAQEEDGVEVDVLQPFGVGGDAGDETWEVRALRDRACEDEGGSGMSQWRTHPGACCLVHVFVTYMRRYTRVKTRDDLVVHSTLQALLRTFLAVRLERARHFVGQADGSRVGGARRKKTELGHAEAVLFVDCFPYAMC